MFEKLEFNFIRNSLNNLAYTFEGKKLALNLKPSSNSLEVRSLLNETQDALNATNINGNFPISALLDFSLWIKKLKSSSTLTAKGLLDLCSILRISRELSEYYKKLESNISLETLKPYFEALYSNKDIEKKISSAIISEDLIADEASNKLFSIRQSRKSLESDIKSKLNAFIHSSSHSKYIMDPVVTIRSGRFVVPIKEEYKSVVKGFIHDTSSSGSTVYIEPMAVFEINNKINDLLVEENKEIERILQELSNLLIPIADKIESNIYLIGKLDFISAKAKLAIDMNATMPLLTTEINLIKARHPLIPKDKVVPIDIYVGKNFSTLVITGPNTGGKTVSLKTVGLLCLMAQSGLFIPASENSTVKVFDNVFADIGDEQSIEESLSTFSSHMTNIVNIVDKVTSKSLVLVDELGSGTDPIEGANLAIALLEYFHNKGAITIATTHYHEIKNYCITHDGFENASEEFNIEKLEPTYKLLIGIPGKSNAFAISKRLGLPSDILDRANSLMNKPDTDIETLMKEIYDDRITIENLKKEEEKNLHQVELLRKNLENQVSDRLANEEKKIEKAKKEAREILLDAKQEANRIIKELNNIDSFDLKKANQLRDELNSNLKETETNSGLDLSVLLKLNNQETSKPTNKNTVHINNSASKHVSSEINLLGENVDTAINTLDKYLDNCAMAHLKQVRVIHGKGTGKLREGIHAYLKTSKYVKSYRIAGFGEGDYGVTIVELK